MAGDDGGGFWWVRELPSSCVLPALSFSLGPPLRSTHIFRNSFINSASAHNSLSTPRIQQGYHTYYATTTRTSLPAASWLHCIIFCGWGLALSVSVCLSLAPLGKYIIRKKSLTLHWLKNSSTNTELTHTHSRDYSATFICRRVLLVFLFFFPLFITDD